MKYTSSNGWIISTRKLKADDRLALKEMETEAERVAFVDDLIPTYLKAWGVDIVDIQASLKSAGLIGKEKGLKS
jgi:hypothetical protein